MTGQLATARHTQLKNMLLYRNDTTPARVSSWQAPERALSGRPPNRSLHVDFPETGEIFSVGFRSGASWSRYQPAMHVRQPPAKLPKLHGAADRPDWPGQELG
jgi:hypothetical protein